MKNSAIRKTLIAGFIASSVLGLCVDFASAGQRSKDVLNGPISGPGYGGTTCPFSPYGLPPGHPCSLDPLPGGQNLPLPWEKPNEELTPLSKTRRIEKEMDSKRTSQQEKKQQRLFINQY